MTDQSMFNSGGQAPAADPQPAPAPQPAAPVDPYSDMLKLIQGDNGQQKYATVSDALNSIPHANQFIDQLKSENAQLREKAAKVDELERQMEQIMASQQQQPEPGQSALGEAEVAQLVQQQMQALTLEQQVAANQQSVVAKLVDKFGEKAEQMYNQKAQELGLNVNILNQLAGQSPAAVLNYFGEVSQPLPQTSETSVNTAALENKPTPPALPKKSVLAGGASTADLIAEWRAAGDAINKK